MNCGCGTRAGKLLTWLGFAYEDPNRWHFRGRQGAVVIELNITTQHTRLSVLALWHWLLLR